MTRERAVRKAFVARPIEEGGGVRLRRAFGPAEVPLFDPFLLLDDFRSDRPEDYAAGFPEHPHRGFETVTYVLRGEMEHRDSAGNRGVVGAGGAQWMTAGRGIVHSEMPRGDAAGVLWGFQLWANLPASRKMAAPRYRGVSEEEIPVVNVAGEAVVRLICGRIGAVEGPIRGVVTDPELLDVSVPAGVRFGRPIPRGHTAFAYVFEGRGRFGPAEDPRPELPKGVAVEADGRVSAGDRAALLFGDGERIEAEGDGGPVRFLLAAGRPLGEPVAWRGSIVMTTDEEVRAAYRELREGTFVKK